jgi:uncharacterized integral membrane protein
MITPETAQTVSFHIRAALSIKRIAIHLRKLRKALKITIWTLEIRTSTIFDHFTAASKVSLTTVYTFHITVFKAR